MTRPSGSSSHFTPNERSTLAIVAMRSLSLTRSSSASRIVVVPRARGERAGDRDLVDRARDELAPDEPSAQRCIRSGDLGDGLAALIAAVGDLEGRAHVTCNLEKAGACRVRADAAHGDARSGDDA